MTDDFYADIAPIFDRMIRWERRLAFEAPLFETLWQRTGARRVLDASCGSGRHLALFARQGRQVTGADASAAMLALAEEQIAALPADELLARPRLVEATWAQLPERLPETFDAVLCLGNSLPYVTDAQALAASLAGLWSRVAPGGVLLVQFRNFGAMRAKGERFLPLSSRIDPEEGTETLCLRQYEWHERTVDFTVILLQRTLPAGGAPAAGEWTLRHWTTPLATWPAEAVSQPLRALGARVTLHGALDLIAFDPAASDDVVILAQRP